MAFTIRLATRADSEKLLAIEAASFPTDQISARQMRYLLSKAKAQTWVSEQAGIVVGYLMLFVPTLPAPARLYSIAIDKEYQGKGLASLLIQQAIAFAISAGYRRIRLEVRKGQTLVQQLYERHGFCPYQTLPRYYGDGEDGIRMEKRL